MTRQLLLGGLVLHDSENRDTARVLSLAGFDDTAGINALLVPNTGGAGVRAAGVWTAKEKYPTVTGRLAAADRAAFEAVRAQLLAACPIGEEVTLSLIDDTAPNRQLFVYRYDVAEILWQNGLWAAYTLPLVAVDPFQYATDQLSATCGVFTGDQWYREYTAAAGGQTTREYTLVGGVWVREYVLQQPVGLPSTAQLVSDGDQTSERVTVTVNGPLTAGDWYLTNLATGEQLWANLSLIHGQTLTFDCFAQTATLNGSEDVTDFVFGDWLRLPPGGSQFQLVAGVDRGASATFTALPAYE